MSNEDSKSRSGRFDLPANELVEAFNATITFEQRVCPFDIEDSKVHATMLARQNIISKEDAEAICRGLDQVAKKSAPASSSSPSRTKTFTWPSKSA